MTKSTQADTLVCFLPACTTLISAGDQRSLLAKTTTTKKPKFRRQNTLKMLESCIAETVNEREDCLPGNRETPR